MQITSDEQKLTKVMLANTRWLFKTKNRSHHLANDIMDSVRANN